jgi:hypothetical protein
MATVLEECATEEQRSIVRFCGQKDSIKRILIKFPVCSGKCLSRKAVHKWVDKFFQGRTKAADGARPGAEVGDTTVKRLVKRWDKCINVGGGYVDKYMFLPGWNITYFTFYINLLPIFFTLPRTKLLSVQALQGRSHLSHATAVV